MDFGGFLLLVFFLAIFGLVVRSVLGAQRDRRNTLARAAEWQRQQAIEAQVAAAQAERHRQIAAEQAERKRQWAADQAEQDRQAAVRRHAWQLSRWPDGITLDNRISNIDGIVPQVAAQNEMIESGVRQLNNLLQDGLRYPKEVEPTASYLSGDPKGITEFIESTLTSMQLRTGLPRLQLTRGV